MGNAEMMEGIKKVAMSFVVTLLILLLVFAVANIWNILQSTAQSEKTYQTAQKIFATEHEETEPQVDWAALRQQYPDIVGWLSCPDTELDYPVVQGEDNEFYLTHLTTGEANKHGAVFMDYRNAAPLTDANTILYGHNMQDGTMFHNMLNWGNGEYAAAHRVLSLTTPYQTYALRVFNACVVDASSEVYQLAFEDTVKKADWLDRCARKSFFTAEFVPSAADSIMTLSTCSGSGRWFVVQAAVQIE